MGRKKISESNPRKGETEVGKQTIDRITRKPTFNFFDKPQIGDRFHIFRQKGEELVGELVGGPIVNLRCNSSWAIKIDSGDIVEIFGNKTLHDQLRKVPMFSRIRITYIGYEANVWRYPKKIYRVYKIR